MIPVVIMLVVGIALFIGIQPPKDSGADESDCNEVGSVCYEKRMGIKAYLPYFNPLYSITYSEDSDSNIIIDIDAYEGYRNAAVNKIYEFGYNPANFIINFNYNNPFEPYE